MMREYQLVVPAGGECTRMAHLTKDRHKSLLEVNGKSLISRLIGDYYTAGVRRVVILSGKHEDSLREHIYESDRFPSDLQTIFSSDPPQGKAGSAGAVLNALRNKSIDPDMTMIVHNPDDLILVRDYPQRLIGSHDVNVKLGARASLMVVSAPFIHVPYTLVTTDVLGLVLTLKKGQDIALDYEVHTGVTVICHEIFPLFERLVEEGKDQSFESVVLSTLVPLGRLAVIPVRREGWIAINDPQSYDKAKQVCKEYDTR